MNIKLKTTFLAIFISAFIVFSPSGARADSCSNPSDNPCWVTKAPMPTARRDLGVASDSTGRIYAVGGYNGSFLNTLEMYNPTTDTWVTRAPSPVQRNALGFTFSSSNGKFYSAGGYNNGYSNNLFEYDPITDSWTAKSSMQVPRAYFGLVSGSNGKLYAIGGQTSNGTAVATVEEYDPATDQWTTKVSLPTPRTALGVVAAPNGKIYAIGGHLDSTNNSVNVATVEEYDPTANSWTTRTSMSTARAVLGISVNGQGKIYAIAGDVGDPNIGPTWTDIVEEYDFGTDTWTTKTPFPFQVESHGAAFGSNDKVYVIGGYTQNSVAVNTNYAGFISNKSPVLGSVIVAPNPVMVNASVSASANFTDVNTGDRHTATIDWGDGSGTQFCSVTELNGSGSVSCTRPSGYSIANVYPVMITVSDDSLSGISPVQYVSVYNPTQQSIFTAGHRFSSPIGAYPQNNTLTGDVTFGLSYKYQGSMPVGMRQFSMDFKAANLSFNATTISSLVISNEKATLRGIGTVNGIGTYDFLVVGVDRGGIRFKITDSSSNNAIVYDTQVGDSDIVNPTTPVTGSVIVH